ncbi:MAG: hypothetical protein M1483_08565 [Actinobacteria bacterium]|nr:hypothetical protein [Actinomycetota bacterium]MCL6105654.1 hypothetical protein [Actinomycetota bacterium]
MSDRRERNRRYQEKLKAGRAELVRLREEKSEWEAEKKMIYTTLQPGVNDLIDKHNDLLKYVFVSGDDVMDNDMIESYRVNFIKLPDIEITDEAVANVEANPNETIEHDPIECGVTRVDHNHASHVEARTRICLAGQRLARQGIMPSHRKVGAILRGLGVRSVGVHTWQAFLDEIGERWGEVAMTREFWEEMADALIEEGAELATRGVETGVHSLLVAANPSAPPEVLAELAGDEDDERMRRSGEVAMPNRYPPERSHVRPFVSFDDLDTQEQIKRSFQMGRLGNVSEEWVKPLFRDDPTLEQEWEDYQQTIFGGKINSH